MGGQNLSYTLKSHLALFTVALIYGGNYSIAKIVLDGNYIGPRGFIVFRVLCGAILISIVHSLYIKEKMKRQDIVAFIACALFGVTINQLFFFIGLRDTVPINAALIMTMTPVLILLLSVLFKAERLNFVKIIGVVLGLMGTVYLITNGGILNNSFGFFKADIFILINALSYGVYVVLAKKMMERYHPLTVVKWAFVFGFFFVLPFGWSEVLAVKWSTFDNTIWLSFIYVLFCTTFLAYTLNAYALNRVTPTVAGTYICFQPLLAAFIAIQLGKDSLDSVKIISGVFIFIGIYLVSFYRSGVSKNE